MDIYGTLGPACASEDVLAQMFAQGMTGIRLNLSHTTLKEAEALLGIYHRAAEKSGVNAKLLIDMQGPEVRMGKLPMPIELREDMVCPELPFPQAAVQVMEEGDRVLLDDGKLLLQVIGLKGYDGGDKSNHKGLPAADYRKPVFRVLRGGLLKSGKSLAIEGKTVQGPAVTEVDRANLKLASQYGVTGVMQPFVRSREDLKELWETMQACGCPQLKIFAKIENMTGVRNLESFFDYADEIVIARGDLGNSMPLWELPSVQADLSRRCRQAGVPFMVVTQMLASMETRAVPTRAEVNDIYHAVLDGAGSVMVTGETAAGQYPIEVMQYLAQTVRMAEKDR